MTSSPIEVASQFVAAASSCDGSELRRVLAPDVRWRRLGRATAWGEYLGVDNVLRDLIGDIFVPARHGGVGLETIGAAATGNFVILTAESRARQGGDYCHRHVFAFEVADGQICSVREYVDARPVTPPAGPAQAVRNRSSATQRSVSHGGGPSWRPSSRNAILNTIS